MKPLMRPATSCPSRYAKSDAFEPVSTIAVTSRISRGCKHAPYCGPLAWPHLVMLAPCGLLFRALHPCTAASYLRNSPQNLDGKAAYIGLDSPPHPGVVARRNLNSPTREPEPDRLADRLLQRVLIVDPLDSCILVCAVVLCCAVVLWYSAVLWCCGAVVLWCLRAKASHTPPSPQTCPKRGGDGWRGGDRSKRGGDGWRVARTNRYGALSIATSTLPPWLINYLHD